MLEVGRGGCRDFNYLAIMCLDIEVLDASAEGSDRRVTRNQYDIHDSMGRVGVANPSFLIWSPMTVTVTCVL